MRGCMTWTLPTDPCLLHLCLWQESVARLWNPKSSHLKEVPWVHQLELTCFVILSGWACHASKEIFRQEVYLSPRLCLTFIFINSFFWIWSPPNDCHEVNNLLSTPRRSCLSGKSKFLGRDRKATGQFSDAAVNFLKGKHSRVCFGSPNMAHTLYDSLFANPTVFFHVFI